MANAREHSFHEFAAVLRFGGGSSREVGFCRHGLLQSRGGHLAGGSLRIGVGKGGRCYRRGSPLALTVIVATRRERELRAVRDAAEYVGHVPIRDLPVPGTVAQRCTFCV